MDSNFRVKQIEDLDLFIQEKETLLQNVLNQLCWKEELLEEVKVMCPINPEHWIPESSLSQHIETCEWVHDGYVKDELKKQPPDSSFFYKKSSAVIPVSIDSTIQQKVLAECGFENKGHVDLPKTIDRWTTQLNSEQRLSIYDYIVNVAKTANKPKNVTLEDLMIDFERKGEQEDKPKSQLEIMAEMRDYKRRRQSYRAKNVHITKKSYTEIMKEVIENQTTYLAEVKKFEGPENTSRDHEDRDSSRNYSQNDSETFLKHREYAKSSENSRKHRSRSSSYSPKRKKHKRDRSRSRSRTHKHKKSHKHKRSHD